MKNRVTRGREVTSPPKLQTVGVRLSRSTTRSYALKIVPQTPSTSVERYTPNSLVRDLVRPSFEEHTEIEVPYFTLLSNIDAQLDLSKLATQHLYQAYIPEKNLHEVLLRLGSTSYRLRNLDESMLSRARLRRVTNVRPDARTDERYFLQLKSAKAGGVSRTELGIELPASRFFKLLPLASAGAVEKIRYIKPGVIRSIRGKKYLAEAHLDVLLSAGKDAAPYQVRQRKIECAPFAFIDVELPSPQLIPLLAEPSRHTFRFLSNALAVLDHEKWIRQATATRYLASNGLNDPLFQKAIRRLTRRLSSVE